jgi:hypothetical protein
MPKLDRETWLSARAAYETGTLASLNAVASEYGVSRRAVQRHATSERWVQDLEPVIRRKTSAKVALKARAAEIEATRAAVEKAAADAGGPDAPFAPPVPPPPKPMGYDEAIADAVDAEAERRAEVLRRHREEPQALRAMGYAAMKRHRSAETREDKQLAFEDLKAWKISTEAIKNVHALERDAWGLSNDLGPATGAMTAGLAIRVEYVGEDA